MLQRFPALEPTHVLQLRVLLSAVIASFLCVALLLFVVVPSGVLQNIARQSGGWLGGTLLSNLLMFAWIVGVVLCAWGGLGPRALGLQRGQLLVAALTLLGGWLLLNLVAALWQLASDGELDWSSAWSEHGYAQTLGRALGQLAGNALYEEVFYRAVLLRQLYWQIARFRSPSSALAIAVFVSQALFALAHGVTFLTESAALSTVLARLLAVFCAGCAFAWLYLTTGKLLVVVAVHALVNAPSLVVADPFGYDNLPLLLTVCLLARVFCQSSIAQRDIGFGEAL
jgi:membrane protease YdiL (CAAX protease family)